MNSALKTILTPEWATFIKTVEKLSKKSNAFAKKTLRSQPTTESDFTAYQKLVRQSREDWYSVLRTGADESVMIDTAFINSGEWGFPFGFRSKVKMTLATKPEELRGVARELAAWKGVTLNKATQLVNSAFNSAIDDEDATKRIASLFARSAHAVPNRKFVFIDIETTGGSPADGELIEIGIIITDAAGKELDKLSVLFDLDKPQDREEFGIMFNHVHNIEHTDLKGKASLSDSKQLEKIAEILNDPKAIFVAHNSRFELEWLSFYIPNFWENHNPNSEASTQWERSHFLIQDTRFIASFLSNSPKGKLSSFVEHMGLKYKNAHRATNDARMTARAYFKFRKELAKKWQTDGDYKI